MTYRVIIGLAWTIGVCSISARGDGWILRLHRPDPLVIVKIVKAGMSRFGPDGRFVQLPSNRNWDQGLLELGEIQPDFIYGAAEQADPNFSNSWSLLNVGQILPTGLRCATQKDIGLNRAWDLWSGSEAAIVAVLDTGLALGHEEFQRNVWRNPAEVNNALDDDGNGLKDDVFGWNFVDDNPDVSDDSDHGSLVSGILGANQNATGTHGVLRTTQIMPLKILDAGGMGSSRNVIRAIEYAVKHGARVINASFGGREYDPALRETIDWAGRSGVLFIAAAGNDGKNNDTSSKRYYPASFNLQNLISVAAYDCQDKLWSTGMRGSNYGATSVHIGAPGAEIYSTTRSGYRFGSGTSFAAPIVSGVAALVASYLPLLTPEQIRSRLIYSSEVVEFYEREHTQSAGRVRADWALEGRVIARPGFAGKWELTPYNWSTPSPYPNDFHDGVEIHVPGAVGLRVVFNAFEIEEDYDVVTVTDGLEVVAAKYTGHLGDFTGAQVLGDRVKVRLDSDGTGTGGGFRISGVDVIWK